MNKELKSRYEKIKALVTERRDSFDKLMEFVENETSYMTAPASTRFHLCRESGLLEHSLNVAENLLALKERLYPMITDESCAIVSLLHDLGKAGMPGNPLYIANEPTERQRQYGYPASVPYRYNDALTYLSVPVRSLYLILPFISLSEDETQAVLYHDGQYVEDNRSSANKETPLTLLLHFADCWSSMVVEK